MRRNIKNDKVIKAITIGLATMIAATSAPLDVLADTEGKPSEQATDQTQGADGTAPVVEASAAENVNNEQQTAEVIDVSTALKAAEELVPSSNQPSVEADVALGDDLEPAGSDAVASTGLIKAASDAVTPIKDQLPIDPTVQLDEAEKKVEEVKDDLTALNGVTPVDLEYAASFTEDEKPQNDSIPVLKTSEPEEYYSDDYNSNDPVDFYDEADNGSDFVDESGREMPFVKSIVANYKSAVENLESGNTNAAFKAAADADDQLTEEEQKIKALDEAIKSSEAANNALKSLKEDLEAAKTIKKKYDVVMTQYFREMINGVDNQDVFNKDGSINVEKCINVLKAQKNGNAENDDGYVKAINDKADNPGGNLTNYSRDLFCELVKQEIKNLGGTEIKFDLNGKTNQGMAEGNVYLNSKNHAQVANAGTKANTLYKINGDAIGGRNNRFAVSYIPEGKTEADRVTVYFNYVYKSTKVDNGVARGDDLDLESGIFYLAEIKEENSKWVVKKSNTLFDDYNRYANGSAIDNALNAVVAAETRSAELKDAVNAIRDKVLGISAEEYDRIEDYESACADKLAELKKAAKYSRVKLNALKELIGPMKTDEDGNGGGDATGGEETGGTVIDGGDVSVVIPGGFTLPAGMLDAFGGTGTTGGGTTSGVLGVRTGGGTEADEGGAADSRTNVAPRANFSTVNKVLGSKQKKDNSQLAKKIKDNEIPLAEIPNMDDEVTMNWMWLLIIFLLGATGKKMYDEYKKKKEAEEAAKIDK